MKKLLLKDKQDKVGEECVSVRVETVLLKGVNCMRDAKTRRIQRGMCHCAMRTTV